MRTLRTIRFWFQRWSKESYSSLWYEVHGGRDEGDKGLRRWRNFDIEVWGSWKKSYESEMLLRLEAEQALTEAGIPIPREVRYEKIMEKFKK